MKLGFVLKPQSETAVQLYQTLAGKLADAGHQTSVLVGTKLALPVGDQIPAKQFATESELVIVLGGDGTMLGASAALGACGTHVLGINLGRLGFLTTFATADALDAINAAIAGELEVHECMRLGVTYTRANGEAIERTALNDAVIHQGTMARLIELEAHLNGDLITNYRADGLIISSPTGSTAYNLAAGGPILLPGHTAIAITPICAHALTNRPLVVTRDSTISVAHSPRATKKARSDGRDAANQAVLTVDGQWAHPFAPGDRVDIRMSPHPFKILGSRQNHFDILRQKLHWGVQGAAALEPDDTLDDAFDDK